MTAPNRPRVTAPAIEATISRALMEQIEEWSEEFITTASYYPDMTGEAALKTLATAHGIRSTVLYLRSIYEGQQAKEQTDGRPKTDRWGPAGTRPQRSSHPHLERPADKPPSEGSGAE